MERNIGQSAHSILSFKNPDVNVFTLRALKGNRGSTVLAGTKASLGILNPQMPNVTCAASSLFYCLVLKPLSLLPHCWDSAVSITMSISWG